MMSVATATITLLLVMDPLGNVPIFLSVLHNVEPKKRKWIILRECAIAFVVLVLFLFFGSYILKGLGISMPALSIAGGIILFLIALRMIFPVPDEAARDTLQGEPFIVPLAIPLVAGPSALATVMLFASRTPELMSQIFFALVIATAVSLLILLFSEQLRTLLGKKGLIAVERLMGMILTTVAVQMFLSGIHEYLKLN